MTQQPDRGAGAIEHRSGDLTPLRAQAEELLARLRGQGAQDSAPQKSVSELAHDLTVHRIEVDLQRDELLRVRDELDSTAEQYAHLYDFAPSGIMSIDADGMIVRSNLAAAQLLRTERSRLQGRPFVEFVAPDDHGEFVRILDSARHTSTPNVCEVDLAVESSAPVSVVMDVRVTGNRGGWEIALVDMSEMRAAQREIGELARVAAREEIGRQLHDTVLQRLFGVSSSLQALLVHDDLDLPSRQVLERMAEELHVTVREIWHTVFDDQS